ncbi:MAG: hypothetical protein ACE5DQ_01235 [Candidatus Paceibacterota bacterium]
MQTLIIFLLALLIGNSAFAAESSSPRFQLKSQEVNFGTNEARNASIPISLDATSLFNFQKKGYVAHAGYTHLPKLEFSFSVSRTALSFGEIDGKLSTQTSTQFTISPGQIPYLLFTSQLKPLSSLGKSASIPNTTCDARCTPKHASKWTNPSKHGFGYTLDSLLYRPFTLNNAEPVLVMDKNAGSSDLISKQPTANTAKLTLKVQTPPDQPKGTYRTTIELLAMPSY